MKKKLTPEQFAELQKELEGSFYFANPPAVCQSCGCQLPNHYAGCFELPETKMPEAST